MNLSAMKNKAVINALKLSRKRYFEVIEKYKSYYKTRMNELVQ